MENRKYEFTSETKNWRGYTLHRIRAVRDFTLNDGTEIKKGDLGGFVESENNLSHEDNSWISDNSVVAGNAKLCWDAYIHSGGMITSDKDVALIGPFRCAGCVCHVTIYHTAYGPMVSGAIFNGGLDCFIQWIINNPSVDVAGKGAYLEGLCILRQHFYGSRDKNPSCVVGSPHRN